MSRSASQDLSRFSLLVPTEDYETLGELAGLMGVSRASLVRDLIESARPVWAVLLDAARAQAAAGPGLRSSMERLADELATRTTDARALMDAVFAALDKPEADGPDGPPPSNTGVRN